MDSIDDSEIELSLILESRKQTLQELKEEMKDVLFDEFIENQGDFMDIEIPSKKEGKTSKNVMLSNGGTGGLFFTPEELKLFENPPNANSVEQSMNNLINQQKAIIGMAPIGWRPPRGSPPLTEKEKNDIKLEIERLEYEKYRLVEESKNKYETWRNLITELVKKKEQENEEYQKMVNNLPGQNNEILKYFTEAEFEERFWNYVSDNDGFPKGVCPKCRKVPNIGRKSEYYAPSPYDPFFKGLITYKTGNRNVNGKNKQCWVSGKIDSISCCKFKYNLSEKKMYKNGNPCEEYDFKTKKDLYEEMETMKANFKSRLLKLEKLLNP